MHARVTITRHLLLTLRSTATKCKAASTALARGQRGCGAARGSGAQGWRGSPRAQRDQNMQLDDEQKWPPVMTTLLLALEAALNSVMHSLPHAPFPAMASLLEDPLLLQTYQRPPQLNFQPQLSPRVQSYFRHARKPKGRGPKLAAASRQHFPRVDGRQHRMATVLNGALNAVLAARPEPARALGVLAEELRRSSASSAATPKPAPPQS